MEKNCKMPLPVEIKRPANFTLLVDISKSSLRMNETLLNLSFAENFRIKFLMESKKIEQKIPEEKEKNVKSNDSIQLVEAERQTCYYYFFFNF